MTQTYRASIYSTTGAATYATTGTYTPAANSLLVALVVGCGDTSDPNHATAPFAGHGVSWTKLTLSANSLSTTHALSVWVADAGSSPTSAACTAQWLTNRTGAAIIEYEITGADLTGGAAAAIKQQPTNTGTGTSGTLSLASPFNADSRPLAFFVHLANQGTTPRAGWTEPSGADGNFNNPATGIAAQHRDDAFETTASASWTTSSAWRGIGLEVAGATALTLALGVGSLAATGAAVGVGFAGPATGSLEITGQTPAVNVASGGAIVLGLGDATLTGAAPTLAVAGTNPVIAVPAGAAAITGHAPFPALAGSVTSLPPGSLAATGASVGVGFSGPATGDLVLTGRTPTVSSGSIVGPTIFVPAGTLSTVTTYIRVQFGGPTEGALTLTGYAPGVSSSIKQVPAGALALVGRTTPIALTTAGTVGSLSLLGRVPDVVVGPGAIIPATGSLTLTGRAPAIAIVGSPTIVVPAASLTLTGRAPSIVVSLGDVQLYVGGVLRPFKAGTLHVSDDINGRNSLTVTIWDAAGTYHPTCGLDLVLYDTSGVVLFAGTIDEPVEETIIGVSPGYLVHLTAVDYNQLADRRIAAVSYDETTFTAIVTDLVARYLAEDGVTVGTVDAGPTFVRKTFNYRSVADCLNELSEDTGYTWEIDSLKQLHVRNRASITSSVILDASPRTILSFRVASSRAQYRNRQYIRAGRDLTDPLTESFRGDGTRQTFTCGLPLGTEPAIWLDGVPQTVGIRNVESASAFEWFWNKDSNEITQRTTGVPVADTSTLTVVYRGLFPVLIQAQRDADILDRQAVEGGSGLYEAIEDFTDVDSADLAFDAALAKLERYGMIRRTITVTTDQASIRSGQLVRVTVPTHGIDDDYLVSSVRAYDVQGLFLRYDVTLMDGDAIGGWLAFYQRLMSKRRDAVARENEQLLLMRHVAEPVTCGETLVIDTPVSKETRIGLAQIGRSEVGTT